MKIPVDQSTPITPHVTTQSISQSSNQSNKSNDTEQLYRKLHSRALSMDTQSLSRSFSHSHQSTDASIDQPISTLMHPLSELLRIADSASTMTDEEAEITLASLSMIDRDLRSSRRTPGTSILPTFESFNQLINQSPFNWKRSSDASSVSAAFINERNAQLIESNNQLKAELMNEQREHRLAVDSLKQQINQSTIDHQQKVKELNETTARELDSLRNEINRLTEQINQLTAINEENCMILEDKHASIALLKQEIAGLKHRENQFLDDHESAFETLTALVRDREQLLLDTLQNHEAAMNRSRERIAATKAILIDKITQQHEHVRNLQANYDAAVAAHAHCETDRSALEAQLKGLNDDLMCRQRDYDRLAQQSSQFQKTSQSNEIKLRALIERLEDEVNDRESILQMTEYRLTERHNAVLQSVEDARLAAERQSQQLRNRLVEMEHELDSYVQQYDALHVSSERRGEIQSLKLQLDEVNHSLMSKDSELAVVRANQQQLEARLRSRSAASNSQVLKLSPPSDMDPVTLILMWFVFMQIACAILYAFSDELPSWSDIEGQIWR